MTTQQEILLSVIMPVYNGEKYLAAAIESVLSQTYSHFEFFIVDDASTDQTNQIITQYAKQDSRIFHLANEHNAKQSEARNQPIRKARGKYIVLVDSDDICLTNRFEKQLKFLQNNPGIDVVGSSYCLFADNNIDDCQTVISAKVDDIYHGMPPVHNPTCMIKRSTFLQHGFYDSQFDNAEDVELWFRWFSRGVKFANISEILYKKRNHRGSVSISNIKSQVYLLFKINVIAATRYHIRFSLKGYLHALEQLLYFFYLTFRLDRIYTKNHKG